MNDNNLDRRFQKQSECFQYSIDHNIANPLYYAYDDISSSKTFGVLPIRDFLIQYNDVPSEDKNFYEIIKHDRPMKECYDIEIELNDFGRLFEDEIFKPSKLYEYFDDLYTDFNGSVGIDDEPLFLITDSSNETKLSLHIVNKNRVFKNYRDMEFFMNKFRYYMKEVLDAHPVSHCIDLSIVSKNRQMRLPLSSKKGQDRPLIAPAWHTYSYERKSQIEHFIITNCDGVRKKDFFKVPKEWKQLKIIVRQNLSRKERKNIEPRLENIQIGTEEELAFLIDNIPDYLIDEYHSWVRLIFCLIKLGVSSERIHDISKMSDKYNEKSCDTVINSFDMEKCNMNINTLRIWCGSDVLSTSQSVLVDRHTEDDDFYFMDFFRKHHKVNYESEAELLEKVIPDIHKVFSFIHGKNVLVVKEDKKTHFALKTKQSIHCIIKELPFFKFFCDYDKHFYHYNKMVFKPEGHNLLKDELNTWIGFEAKEEENFDINKIQLFLNHIKEVWASGNDEYYNYIITWLASIVQTPWKKTMVALLIQGDQGSGKGLITDFLMVHLFGLGLSEQTIGIDKLVQRFNGCIASKLFINPNELVSITDGFNNVFDRLKPLITDNFIQVEQKGIEPFTIENNANFIMTTNHSHTIKVERCDRRYALFSCDNKYTKNFDYFDKLSKSLTQDCANNLFTYLKKYEIKIDLRRIPETELRRETISLSLPNPIRFLKEIQENLDTIIFDICHNQKFISPTSLFQEYIGWCEECREKAFSMKVFGTMIKGNITQDNKKINGKQKRYYDMKTIVV